MKEKYDHRLLLKHLPSDLRVFLEHIQVYQIITPQKTPFIDSDSNNDSCMYPAVRNLHYGLS